MLRVMSRFVIKGIPCYLLLALPLMPYILCIEQVSIINPRRACAARVTVVVLCVGLFVCLFVSDYSRTTGYEAAHERYQQLQCYKSKKRMWQFC